MNINKANIIVGKCASTDESKYHLNSIHFTKDFTESTNGHILARMSYPEPQFDPADVPDVIKTGPKELIQPFIIPVKALKDVKFPKRSSLPVLMDLYVDVDSTNQNGNAKFGMTDLQTTSTPEVKKMEGEFPETDRVWPTIAPVIEICVNPAYLKTMCDIAGGMGDKIKLTLYDANSPIKVSARDNNTQQEFTGLVMPMRD